MIKFLTLAFALCLSAAAAHAQAVAGRPTLFMATAVNATNPNAQVITTSGGFTNTALNIVCANFTAPNTGNATVAVDGKAALAVQTQIPGGLSPLGGNELMGYQCLQVNVGATSFVLGGIHGGITVNPAAHNVTSAEWTYGWTFVCVATGCNLTFPAVNTLSGQGGVTIATIGVQATLTPATSSGDAINAGQVGGGAANAAVTFPADMQSFIITTGANALTVPMGPVRDASFAWMPGMDLNKATTGFGVKRSATPLIVYAINCENDIVESAGSMQFYQQTANGAINAGTTIGSAFNMTAGALAEATNLLGTSTVVVAANSWIGAAVTPSSTALGQGRCNVSFR
jgi:hypothetical protein